MLLGATKDVGQSKLEPYQYHSVYVAVTRSPGRLESLLKRGWKQFGDGDGLKETKAWTDDRVNIISPLMGARK